MEGEVRKRNGELDFLKFLFSIVIILFHSYYFAKAEEAWFKGGSIAVDFFFIVSGMMMALTASKRPYQEGLGADTWGFMKRKLAGLMPNVYVAWCIAFVVSHLGNFYWKDMIKDALNSIWELLFITNTGAIGYVSNAPAWYLSAMLLLLFLLYPVLRKYQDNFFFLIAPLIIVFLLGYSYQEFNNLRRPLKWEGLYVRSTVRAMMEICMGCLSFRAAAYLKKIPFKSFVRVGFSILSYLGYGGVIWYCYRHTGSKADWILVLILWISVTITYSGVGSTGGLFSKRVFSWLGTFSFSLYLGHGFWAEKMTYLFPEQSYYQILPKYLGISVLSGLFIMYSSIGLRGLWKRKKESVKSSFLSEG